MSVDFVRGEEVEKIISGLFKLDPSLVSKLKATGPSRGSALTGNYEKRLGQKKIGVQFFLLQLWRDETYRLVLLGSLFPQCHTDKSHSVCRCWGT